MPLGNWIVPLALVGGAVLCVVFAAVRLRRDPAWLAAQERKRTLQEAAQALADARKEYVATRWNNRLQRWVKATTLSRFRTFRPMQGLEEGVRWMRETDGHLVELLPEEYQDLNRLEEAKEAARVLSVEADRSALAPRGWLVPMAVAVILFAAAAVWVFWGGFGASGA